MKGEIKWALYMIGLGIGLVAYANAQFATKSEVKTLSETVDKTSKTLNDRLEKMEGRIYDIWRVVVK